MDLAYYIKNRKLGIVDQDTGLSVEDDYSEEILLEYTAYDMESIADEESTLELYEYEKELIVYWMRHKYFEMVGDENRSMYYKRLYYQAISDLKATFGESPVIPLHIEDTAMI